MVQCAVRNGGADAGVLHERGTDDCVSHRAVNVQEPLVNWRAGLSAADGSGVGEGGAGRVERAAVSVGQHDHENQANYYGQRPLLRPGPNGYNRLAVRGTSPATSPVGSFAPTATALRHGGECLAVVLGLV